MASIQDKTTRLSEWVAVDVKTHAVATATKAARVATAPHTPAYRHYVTGIIISASASPAAAVAATLSDGTTTITFEIPASAFAPIIWNSTVRFAPGVAVTLTVPDLGSGVVCAITLMGYSRQD